MLFRFIVGGAIWSLIDKIQNIASTAPAAPNKWPMEDFVEDIVTLGTCSASNFSTAPSSIMSAIVDVPWAFM